jgi:hypothetical protein
MRSIRAAAVTLGERLFAEFSQNLRDHELSPVTARGYVHDGPIPTFVSSAAK